MNNNIDYSETFSGGSSKALADRELKGGDAVFVFSSTVSAVTKNGESKKINTDSIDKTANFFQNLRYWNRETAFRSTNNLKNAYFMEIVNMGVDAVPFILEELKKKPSQLVNALDLIFPGVVKYEGFVSIKDACDKWISILQ